MANTGEDVGQEPNSGGSPALGGIPEVLRGRVYCRLGFHPTYAIQSVETVFYSRQIDSTVILRYSVAESLFI